MGTKPFAHQSPCAQALTINNPTQRQRVKYTTINEGNEKQVCRKTRQNKWKMKSGSPMARRPVTPTTENRTNKERNLLRWRSWQHLGNVNLNRFPWKTELRWKTFACNWIQNKKLKYMAYGLNVQGMTSEDLLCFPHEAPVRSDYCLLFS